MNKNVRTFFRIFLNALRTYGNSIPFNFLRLFRFRNKRPRWKHEKLQNHRTQFDEPSSPNCFLWQTSGFSGKPLNFYSTDSPTRYSNEGGVYKVIAKSVSRFSKDSYSYVKTYIRTLLLSVVYVHFRLIRLSRDCLCYEWNHYHTTYVSVTALYTLFYFDALPCSNAIILYYIISWNKIIDE